MRTRGLEIVAKTKFIRCVRGGTSALCPFYRSGPKTRGQVCSLRAEKPFCLKNFHKLLKLLYNNKETTSH